MAPHFRDYSFSNGSQAMQPLDFHYRLSDRGRIVLGQLSSEETVEFELLSRRDREGLMDLASELRLLELYVKYIGSGAEAGGAPTEPVRQISEPPRRQQPPARTAQPRNYIVSMIVIASVSFTLIALLVS
ncbi:hypothetical protein [Bradyrhizobium sp. Bra64]|uniref:hypothetical protein n=1 Tax=Bradyrhizobium sp. Bra64 TaxID=2926009 RepID=UPI0021193A1E|nr:hypothetical protein [Bradyrhizobium sp. Bra64]